MTMRNQMKTSQNCFREAYHWTIPHQVVDNEFLQLVTMVMKTHCSSAALTHRLKGMLMWFTLDSLDVTTFYFRYEVIQPPVADLIPRPKITRGKPLNELEWQTYFDEEGRISKSQEIRMKIFSGVN